MKNNSIYIYIASFLITFTLGFLLFTNSNDVQKENLEQIFEEEYKEITDKLEEREMPQYEIDYKRESNIPKIENELVPNYTGWYDGQRVRLPKVKISINEHGYRDDLYPINKQNDTYRIAAIGDSITFARGVNISDSYAKVLEKKLNQTTSENVEVINFGISGLNIEGKISLIENKIVDYEPDMIIYQHFVNDLYRDESFYELKENFTEMDDLSDIEGVAKDMAAHKATEKQWNEKRGIEILNNNMNNLKNVSKKYSFDVLLFGYQLSDKIKNEIVSITKDFNWTYIDTEDIQKEEYQLHPEDRLPDSQGHKEIADRIYNKIYEKIVHN